MKKQGISAIFLALLGAFPALSQKMQGDDLLERLLKKNSPVFDSVLKHRDDWQVQVIYSTVTHKGKNKLEIKDHPFNLDDQHYYYPASTVKLPVVLLALQKLNELNIPGLDMNSTMIHFADGASQTEQYNDPNSIDGRPCIAQYIKRILLVSDNEAFNRLYEFLGQEYINISLHKLGYNGAEIIHRLDVSLTEEENRHTNPVSFFDREGKLLYAKPAEISKYIYSAKPVKLGKGFMKAGKLVPEPMDFSKKNRLPLSELHQMIRNIMYPASVPVSRRFLLTDSDLELVRTYMSMPATESRYPYYDPAEYWDTYVKFLVYGSEPGSSLPWIRIFNKVGDAYGFLIDGAYIRDLKNETEFFLSAVIYCNSDGILNDDKYDYANTGLPFMKALGQLVLQYETDHKKKNKDKGTGR